MRISVAFRWAGAWWFLPVLFGLGSLHAATSLSVNTGYPVSDVNNTSYVIYLMAPLLSGYAAFAGRRWRRFHATARSRRRGFSVIANSYGPLLVGGPVAVVAAVLVSAGTAPWGVSVWAVLLLDVMAVLACLMLGIACGLAVPPVVAVPVVSIATLSWIIFLPSTSSAYLHHLTPTLTGCCATPNEPSSVALRSLYVLLAIVCLGIAAALAPREWSRRSRTALVAAALLSITLGVLGATASLAASDEDLKLTLVEPRHDPIRCDAVDGVRACSWSEGRDTARRAAQLAAALNGGLRSWGFPEITEVSSSESPGALVIDTSQGTSGLYLDLTLAEGYVRQQLDCPEEGREGVDARTAFLAIALLDVAPDDLRGEFSPESIASGEASAELAADPAAGPGALGDWFLDPTARAGCRPAR